MRPLLSSLTAGASILILSAALSCVPEAVAAEAAAPGGGSQKSSKRPAEGEKKAGPPSQPAPSAGGAQGAEPVKRKFSSGGTQKAAPKPGTEEERFTNARKAASEDPRIVELREKADQSKTKEAADRAMRSYLRALYGKMRTLEPSLEDRINLTEAAALKAVSKGE